MKNIKIKTTLFFLLFCIIAFTLLYKPVSQFIYSKYFYYLIPPELNKEISGLNNDINEYLAKIPEIRTHKSIIPKSAVFCIHTLVGAEKSNSTHTTLYLWAHCQEYGFDGQQLIKGMGALQPVVLFIKKNNQRVYISHKTVPLRKYSKEIDKLFPPYISPHVIAHSPNRINLNDNQLYKKALGYFK